MLRQIIAGAVALSLGSTSYGGVAIMLLPSTPFPLGGYQPGQQINIDILAQLTPGTPSIPNAGGTTSIWVRMLQFDLSDSDAALGITPVLHHKNSEMVPGGVPFWDFSHQSVCASDELSCGTNYLIDGSINDDNLLTLTYVGLTSQRLADMLRLNQTPRRVGELQVTLPTNPGTYVLDVLNADETDPSRGAEVSWGLGYVADPTDPTSPLRASEGEITGGAAWLLLALRGPVLHPGAWNARSAWVGRACRKPLPTALVVDLADRSLMVAALSYMTALRDHRTHGNGDSSLRSE